MELFKEGELIGKYADKSEGRGRLMNLIYLLSSCYWIGINSKDSRGYNWGRLNE